MVEKAWYLKKYDLLKYLKLLQECPEGAEHFDI